MIFQPLSIADVILITPKVFADERGFFMETFRQDLFEQHCGAYQFVQDNHSCSAKGVLRGLHYQLNRPQGKLVRVTQGEAFDVAVDLRQNSPTFGKWVGAFLSEQNKHMLWIPPGFAHGFYVTSESMELQYRCTDYYDPTSEHTIRWNDQDLSIDWPLINECDLLISKKDINGNSLSLSNVYND